MTKDTEEFTVQVDPIPLKIEELTNIEEIATGAEHFIARDKDGVVWAMGDDTFGQ